MSEGISATTPTVTGDSATGPDDVTAVLAQLRETIGNLDALLASVQDVPDLPDEA